MNSQPRGDLWEQNHLSAGCSVAGLQAPEGVHRGFCAAGNTFCPTPSSFCQALQLLAQCLQLFLLAFSPYSHI